jgi:hypothetical protein
VAIYAAGHALALAVGFGLYAAWAIIMPFQVWIKTKLPYSTSVWNHALFKGFLQIVTSANSEQQI